MRMLSIVAALTVSLAVANAGAGNKPSKAKLRQAKAVLAKIKLVDGAGSGLNADTVRGVTPIVVVDSQGNFVGAVMSTDTAQGGSALVVRRIGSAVVNVPVTASGFGLAPQFGGVLLTLHESSDCSGAPFVPAGNGFLPGFASVWGTTIYVASDTPAAMHIIQSVRNGPTPSGCANPADVLLPDGTCCSAGGYVDTLQEATQVDWTTLGVTPPFHVDVTVPQ